MTQSTVVGIYFNTLFFMYIVYRELTTNAVIRHQQMACVIYSNCLGHSNSK